LQMEASLSEVVSHILMAHVNLRRRVLSVIACSQ
jgi:hypothetical protein